MIQVQIDDFPMDNSEWIDTDDDGIGDNSDAYPNDPNQSINAGIDLLQFI